MRKKCKTWLSLVLAAAMLVAMAPASVLLADASAGQASVPKGTPQLGSNDSIWSQGAALTIEQTNQPNVSPKPSAEGTAYVLWDADYLYVRVEVADTDVYRGTGGQHNDDSIEFFVGGTQSAKEAQYRVSATGVLSGDPVSASWTEITDGVGYTVEVKLPKKSLTFADQTVIPFDIVINNSTSAGGDRYQSVAWWDIAANGYNNSGGFMESTKLVTGSVSDSRISITATAETGGSISPTAPGGVLRVTSGQDQTFTFTPDHGKVVDKVFVDGSEVAEGVPTYTINSVAADCAINVTFKNNPSAEVLDFIVYNDNFARGEYTTAVIIDMGQGIPADGTRLTDSMFTVSARNTALGDGSVTFEGPRDVRRVYANDKPEPRGYLGYTANSPDYKPGLDSGRYIVIELDFYSSTGAAAGSTTQDGSQNSTLQEYNVVQADSIPLAGTAYRIPLVVCNQTGVVNPILDKFQTTSPAASGCSLYLHKEAGQVVEGLPLYVYIHGMTRGGTNPVSDPKTAMRSANGAVALMQRMAKDPDKYAAHVLNISWSGFPIDTSPMKAAIDAVVATGAVDADRIYVASFSMGGMMLHSLVNGNPGFFAAAAPMAPVGFGGYPGLGMSFGPPATFDLDPLNYDLAYWIFVNNYNTGGYVENLNAFVANALPLMSNARATLFDSNEAFSWPYSQFDQPGQRPNPSLLDYVAHEVEASVLYDKIVLPGRDLTPTAGTLDTKFADVFDWMFAQSKTLVLGLPASFTATAGSGQVTLTWTAPEDNGAPVTGYKVSYNGGAPVTVAANATSYTFTGLSAQNYTFSIVALNANGNGPERTAQAAPTDGAPPAGVTVTPPSGGIIGGGGNPNPVPTPAPKPAASPAPTAKPTAAPMQPSEPAGTKATATVSTNTLTLNGKESKFPAANIKGYNWLRLRDIAFLLSGTGKQFSVSYDAVANAVIINTGKAFAPDGSELQDLLTGNVNVVASPQKIIVDGKEISMAAYNIDGYNYFRLRDIAILLDFYVTADSKTNAVSIDLSKPYAE